MITIEHNENIRSGFNLGQTQDVAN